MDLERIELQYFGIPSLYEESKNIIRQSQKTFILITLTLITPLSLTIVGFCSVALPMILHMILKDSPLLASFNWYTLIGFLFFEFISLFTFSLLSSAAIVFTVASLYTDKPVSFSSTIAAVPNVFKRLCITFIWISLFLFFFYACLIRYSILGFAYAKKEHPLLIVAIVLIITSVAVVVMVFGGGLWHLACVVTVLEPVHGFGAMKKSYELLRGKHNEMFSIAFLYMQICLTINLGFATAYVPDMEVLTKIIVGVFLVCCMVIVNLMMLVMQSVFYYRCKSYHHEVIDKIALCNHISEYLGQKLPLKSNIQMGNLDV